ncbi:hypothetical protein ABPG72_006889 [Tetrahymena utriculariae]
MDQVVTKAKILLIRHAESMFNLSQRVACNTDQEVPGAQECLVTKFNEELIDCGITPQGYQQCQQAREICQKEDVAVVFVSPLRRALETCEQIFKGHPSNPKIIPHPLFREMVLSNCDIGAKVLESKEIYKNDDFSFLEQYKYPNLWSIYELLDKEKSSQIIQQIEEKCGHDEKEVIRVGHLKLLEFMKDIYPQAVETEQQQLERIVKQKEFLIKTAKEIPQGKKIAVISHSRTLYSFTAQFCHETLTESNGKWFHNGEVHEYEIQLD